MEQLVELFRKFASIPLLDQLRNDGSFLPPPGDLASREKSLKALDLTNDELIQRLASSESWSGLMEDAYDATNEICVIYEQCDIIRESAWSAFKAAHSEQLGHISDTAMEQIDLAINAGRLLESTRRAKVAAEARHSKPNGSREKRAKIQEIWASGKYSSRDICAEQECAALDMSFSTARKALRNTPDPT